MNLLNYGIASNIVLKTEEKIEQRFDGHTDMYDIYEIKLDALYYNDQNDRIATWISKYKFDNGIDKIDTTDKQCYNNLIHQFIYESNPSKMDETQNSIKMWGQQEFGIVLNDGRIVDGNRRFTCLRNLAKENPKYGYFKAIILNRELETNAKEIKLLELQLQHGRELPVEYNAIDKLVGVYNDIIKNRLMTEKEYALAINSSEREVETLVGQAELLVEFLEMINAPHQFHIARDLDMGASLVEIQKILKNKDEDEREDLKYIFFASLISPTKGDRRNQVRKIKTILNSDFSTSFIEEELDAAEKIYDSLPKRGDVCKETLNKRVTGNQELKEVISSPIEKFEERAKKVAIRNQPLNLIRAAYEDLERVDLNVVFRFEDNQKEAIFSELERVQRLLDEMKEAVNE